MTDPDPNTDEMRDFTKRLFSPDRRSEETPPPRAIPRGTGPTVPSEGSTPTRHDPDKAMKQYVGLLFGMDPNSVGLNTDSAA